MIHPAPKPEPRSPRKATRVNPISTKQREKFAARGITNPFCSILPSDSQRKTGRKSRPKKRAAKRERNDPARIYGPEEFKRFLHAQACLGCGYNAAVPQQAHRFTGGTGRKGRWQDSIPLCGPHVRPEIGGYAGWVRGCHASYDAAKQSWSRDHNLPARAAWFWGQYLLHCGRSGIDPQTGKSNV